MAGAMTAKELSDLMFEAALSVADQYHQGKANDRTLKKVARAYSLAAAALQERAATIITDADIEALL